ncbi:MAG TPA: LPXTG cell wall anchor domain-containing protein [Candidatus Nanopelagicales bacterium]|jgi:LPXTG-motif cell wall-anchored protein
MKSRVRLKATGALLTAAATALFGVAMILAPAAQAAPAPTLTISHSTLHAGQTVTLKGTNFPAAAGSLFITICANPPGATNCDVNLAHVKQLAYAGGGSFTTSYTLAVTKFSSAAGSIDCSKTQCVIGTTNAMNPADQSYNSVAKFTVAAAVTPTPTATKSSSSQTPAATASELPRTGAESSTPLVAGAAGVAVLAGVGLLVVSGYRRRARQH